MSGTEQPRAPDLLHGRYRLGRPLGRGSMATAHVAEDLLTGRTVALKLLAAGSAELAASLRAEFGRLRGVLHPNLLRVFDFGRFSEAGAERLYYTADLVEGSTLDLFARGQSWDAVRPAVVDLLRALGFLHRMELLHGDVKPDNVVVDAAGRATLVDLGCSQPFGERSLVSGTPGFMAPEVVQGQGVDARADLYSLGATLRALSPHLRGGLPPAVEELSRRLLSEERANRPADAAEVLEVLGADLTDLVVPSGRPETFVGRQAELSVFRRMVDTLAGGVEGPRVLLVEGADGVGRSRILQEMKWQAQLHLDAVDGDPRAEGAVADLISRALGRLDPPVDLSALLSMREELASRQGAGALLMLDDVHLLDEEQESMLRAVVRSTSPADGCLLVCAGRHISAAESDAVARLQLAPLGSAEVETLLGELAPEGALPELMQATSGYPALVASILDQIRAGELDPEELAGATHPRPEAVAAALARLGPEPRRALGLLALSATELPGSDLAELGISAGVVAELVASRWARRRGAELCLDRALEAESLAKALDDGERQRIHQDLATWLEGRLAGAGAGGRRGAALTAELAVHLSEVGRVDEAVSRLRSARGGHRLAPRGTRRAFAALLQRAPSPALRLEAAELEERLGHPTAAIEHLRPLLESDTASPVIGEARRLAASCYLKLGDARAALDELDGLGDEGPSEAAGAADLRARALIKLGRYGEATTIAEAALEGASAEASLRADLLLDAGLAASYLGDIGRAQEALSAARELVDVTDSPHRRARVAAYRALLELRRGRLGEAARGFEEALTIGETEGLSDQVLHAALNLGTTYHQMGDLGAALDAYERALRLGVALGAVSAEATLRHNMATLFFDVGLMERAEAATEKAEQVAAAAGARLLVAEAASLRGQLSLERGDLDGAADAFDQASLLFGELKGARRELCETELHRAEVDMARGELPAAAARIEGALLSMEEVGATDLRAGALTLKGRVLLGRGRSAPALRVLEEANREASASHSRVPSARAASALADAYEAEGAHSVARASRRGARELLETVAASIPRQWRDRFWQRFGELAPAEEERVQSTPSPREQRLRRLLELTASLSSSLESAEVLSRTMDAAIELTGAERGFVIVASTPGCTVDLEVAVARNVDREGLGRSHLKFSRSIAARTIREGEPVVATDAMADERFRGNQSVHAMRLRSIVCVPIHDPTGVVGALYVDNRFQRGRFTEEDTDLLLAFANHVAVALLNARLHRQLADKNEELAARALELEKGRERIEGLLSEREERIEELRGELDAKQQILEHRYDYEHIVGRGAAMTEVLRDLDRIIPTSATVLISGQSGTGKELVARAVHFNGPRRRGPFVSVNCGALPEHLLESELFGHVRGAFTDAREDKKGLFLAAHGGTLFLDEVGEMPLAMQVKLLRAIEEREVRPVGGARSIPVDIRLLAASNRDLPAAVRAGAFREDLFYRLAVVEVSMPPLRDRVEDIPALCDGLLDRIATDAGLDEAPKLRDSALRALVAHDWPGNVRQLDNVLTRAAVLTSGGTIGPQDLSLPRKGDGGGGGPVVAPAPSSRREFLDAEAREIAALLAAHRWNVSKTARALGISRTTLYAKMRRYGLSS